MAEPSEDVLYRGYFAGGPHILRYPGGTSRKREGEGWVWDVRSSGRGYMGSEGTTRGLE